MLKRMIIDNFTVFGHAELEFGQLNVIHGENGTGKTHLLKLVHTLQTCSRTARAWGRPAAGPERVVTPDSLEEMWQVRVLKMLKACFAQEKTQDLLRWAAKENRVSAETAAGAAAGFWIKDAGLGQLDRSLLHWPDGDGWDDNSVLLPSQDFFSRDLGSRRLAQDYQLREETFGYELLEIVQGPRRTEIPADIALVIAQLHAAIGGKPAVAANGRAFVEYDNGSLVWTSMVATGHNKLAILAMCLERLNTSVGTVLLWDEPEANLNPRLIKVVAKAMVDLAAAGVQVFVATHSLYLMREFVLLQAQHKDTDVRYFGLHHGKDGVEVTASSDLDDTGSLAALDASLEQGDRYLAWGNDQ